MKEDQLAEMARRLATVRYESRLGLRPFARELKEKAGYEVAHTSVLNYEEGTKEPPVGYLLAVAAAFPELVPWAGWILTGDELVLPGEAEAKLEAIRQIVLDDSAKAAAAWRASQEVRKAIRRPEKGRRASGDHEPR